MLARDRILDAAYRVASDHGAGHLTLEAIALAAGVSKGGLLYHFPSKEALIAALAADYVASLSAIVERALAEVRPSSGIGGEIEAHVAGLLVGEGRSRTCALGGALFSLLLTTSTAWQLSGSVSPSSVAGWRNPPLILRRRPSSCSRSTG